MTRGPEHTFRRRIANYYLPSTGQLQMAMLAALLATIATASILVLRLLLPAEMPQDVAEDDIEVVDGEGTGDGIVVEKPAKPDGTATGWWTESLSFLVLLGLNFGMNLLFNIIIAHKAFGPIVRLDAFVQELKRGNFGARVKLRDHDNHQGLARALNELAESLEQRERQSRV